EACRSLGEEPLSVQRYAQILVCILPGAVYLDRDPAIALRLDKSAQLIQRISQVVVEEVRDRGVKGFEGMAPRVPTNSRLKVLEILHQDAQLETVERLLLW